MLSLRTTTRFTTLSLVLVMTAASGCNDDINESPENGDEVGDSETATEMDSNESETTTGDGDTTSSETADTSETMETADTVDSTETADTMDTMETMDSAETMESTETADTMDTMETMDSADTLTTTDTMESSDTMMTTDTNETGEGICEGGCGSPGCFPCPDSPKVNIPGNFTISATEVSNADYEQFLNEDFAPGFLDSWLPPECAWKTDFTPDEWPSSDNLPVAGVDWCDAWAYCEWSGQHMCGKVGGGPSPMNDVQNPNTNEWFKACSQGGIKNYPYGLVYNGALCNGLDAGFEELTEVGSIATCQGGYNGIYDMSGNVWEWTNECVVDDQIPAQDQQCRQRGGSFYSNGPTLRCGIDSTRARNFRNDNLGIRCCDSL